MKPSSLWLFLISFDKKNCIILIIIIILWMCSTKTKQKITKMWQAYGHWSTGLSFVCLWKNATNSHYSSWNGINVWRSHCCNPVCMNLLCCMPTQSITILTSDKQHLHQGHDFLPRGKWEQTSRLTSNKQDAFNCLPQQQKCIPQNVMRNRVTILMVWLIACNEF